jgi:hypothetical protein
MQPWHQGQQMLFERRLEKSGQFVYFSAFEIHQELLAILLIVRQLRKDWEQAM